MTKKLWREYVEFPIKNLSLWDENARFPQEYFNKSEKELIAYFLNDPKFEIREFAKVVVAEFDIPQFEEILVLEQDGKNIVLEGNRRLTVFKLLSNPLLAEDSGIQKFFKDINSIKVDGNHILRAHVTTDIEEGLRFVTRKHKDGNNEVRWGEFELGHHSVRINQGSASDIFKVEISKVVKGLDLPDQIKSDILGKGYSSLFTRIMNNSTARKKLGYEILKNGKLKIENEETFKDLLKIVIHNIRNKKDFYDYKIDSRSLNTVQDISEYFDRVLRSDHTRVDTELESEGQENLFGEKDLQKKVLPPKKILKSKQSPTGLFFASEVPYNLENKCLREIYKELKDIDVAEFPNAAHDLLRSFLECSLAEFLSVIGEYSKMTKTSDDKHLPKLSELITHVTNKKIISDANVISNLEEVKSDWSRPYSLYRMNKVNHNKDYHSTEKDTRAAWNKLEPLFKIILNPKK